MITNRRDFLRNIGLGLSAMVFAPKIIKPTFRDTLKFNRFKTEVLNPAWIDAPFEVDCFVYKPESLTGEWQWHSGRYELIGGGQFRLRAKCAAAHDRRRGAKGSSPPVLDAAHGMISLLIAGERTPAAPRRRQELSKPRPEMARGFDQDEGTSAPNCTEGLSRRQAPFDPVAGVC